MTSAPSSARWTLPNGPAPYCSIATIRTSSSGRRAERSMLDVLLQPRPERRQRDARPAAHHDRHVALERDRVRRAGRRGAHAARVQMVARAAVTVHVDQHFAAAAARTPQPVLIVPADDRRQVAPEKLE